MAAVGVWYSYGGVGSCLANAGCGFDLWLLLGIGSGY